MNTENCFKKSVSVLFFILFFVATVKKWGNVKNGLVPCIDDLNSLHNSNRICVILFRLFDCVPNYCCNHIPPSSMGSDKLNLLTDKYSLVLGK